MLRRANQHRHYLLISFFIISGLSACAPRIAIFPGEQLETAIRARIAQKDSGTVAVSLIDLQTHKELHINGDVSMHAASTMKVPVLIELFRRADSDPAFALDSRIVVRNFFKSIADTSHFTLSVGDDSDSSVYKMIGDTVPLRELARHMIVRSSNLATNIIIDMVGATNVQQTMARIDASGMKVLRGVEDIPAYRKGMNNTATSYGLARSLQAIQECKVTSRKACNEMLQILSGQEFNEMIPAGLPPGTHVAHKTGWVDGLVKHDGAIIYPPKRKPYVLVVLTHHVGDEAAANRIGADISRIVWQRLTLEK